MKLGAILIVNCDKDNIWYCLKGIYDGCDKIVIVHSNCNWNGEPKDDGTLEILRHFRDEEDPDGKIQLIEGSYTSQPGQRTVALEILKEEGLDYCLVIDSDEIYHPEHLAWARRHIEANPDVHIFRVRWLRLWKTLNFRLTPNDGELSAFYKMDDEFHFTERRGTSYRTKQLKEKVVFEAWAAFHHAEKILKRRKKQLRKEKNAKKRNMREKKVRVAHGKVEEAREALRIAKNKKIPEKDRVKVEFMDPSKIVCYHLTTVCDDAQMLEKIQTRSYKDRIHTGWYERKWLNWTPQTRDLHPTSPPQYRRAVPFNREELPDFMETHRFWGRQCIK